MTSDWVEDPYRGELAFVITDEGELTVDRLDWNLLAFGDPTPRSSGSILGVGGALVLFHTWEHGQQGFMGTGDAAGVAALHAIPVGGDKGP